LSVYVIDITRLKSSIHRHV